MTKGEALNLQDVIDAGDWGADPSESYLQSLNLLDNVARECIWVSKGYGGIPVPTNRHVYASVLFTALITRAVSLLGLAPHSSWAEKKIEHWDYASMTGVVRTMIELRAAFHYLCADPCSEEEWYCRWNLFNLHDCVSRERLFEAQNMPDQVAGFQVQADELRDRLRKNSFFQSLDPRRHKKLLHGQTAYLFSLEELAERAGLAIGSFRWLYILFSSHVHALPMSFYRMAGHDQERGRGLPSSTEEGYSGLCLSLAATLLAATRDEIKQLFGGLPRKKAVADTTTTNVEGESDDQTTNAEHHQELAHQALAIGESKSVDLDDTLAFRYKRLSETAGELSYTYRKNNEVVFEGTVSETTGLQFEYIDPYFWEISVDGAKTSREAVERLVEGEFLMRLDVKNLKIHFKTRAHRAISDPATE